MEVDEPCVLGHLVKDHVGQIMNIHEHFVYCYVNHLGYL